MQHVRNRSLQHKNVNPFIVSALIAPRGWSTLTQLCLFARSRACWQAPLIFALYSIEAAFFSFQDVFVQYTYIEKYFAFLFTKINNLEIEAKTSLLADLPRSFQ